MGGANCIMGFLSFEAINNTDMWAFGGGAIFTGRFLEDVSEGYGERRYTYPISLRGQALARPIFYFPFAIFFSVSSYIKTEQNEFAYL